MSGVQGKVAFITGAAQGMGLVTAQEFARRGAIPILADINAYKLEQVLPSVQAIDERATSVVLDVSVKEQWVAALRQAHERFGSLDVLVNNAAISATTPFEEIDEEEWDRIYAVNVKGVLFGCQVAAPYMRQQQSGRIINMASQAGKTGGLVIGAHYSSSKAAVICMTRSFASALGRYAITVNAIAPGIINTDFLRGVPGIENSFGRIVLGGKPGEAIDVASAIVFLASEEARHITGETMNVNGGLLMD